MIRIFFILSILLLPFSVFAVDFNLISPIDITDLLPNEIDPVDVGDEVFAWEDFGGDTFYYKLQMHRPGDPWLNENIPLGFCEIRCEIQPTAFTAINLNFSDRYDWKIVAYNAADNPIGNSQEWSFQTESEPVNTPPPPSPGPGPDPDPGPGPVDPPVPGGIFQIENPISSNSLEELISKLINLVFGLAIVLAPLAILYAGFLMLTSVGDATKLQRARTILIWTVVAFAIILAAKGMPNVIRSIL